MIKARTALKKPKAVGKIDLEFKAALAKPVEEKLKAVAEKPMEAKAEPVEEAPPKRKG